MTEDLRITVLGCRRSAQRAAQAADELKLGAYPVHMVELPCLGRLDIQHILGAFVEGTDGVLVLGCYEDACEHLRGNSLAEQRVTYVQQLLEEAHLDPQRLHMGRVSGAAPHRYVQLVRDFVDKVQALGPRSGGPEKGE